MCTVDEFHMQQWNKLRIVEISTFMLAQNNVGFSQKKYLLSSVSTKQYVALPFLNFTYSACITSVRVKISAVIPNIWGNDFANDTQREQAGVVMPSIVPGTFSPWIAFLQCRLMNTLTRSVLLCVWRLILPI